MNKKPKKTTKICMTLIMNQKKKKDKEESR